MCVRIIQTQVNSKAGETRRDPKPWEVLEALLIAERKVLSTRK